MHILYALSYYHLARSHGIAHRLHFHVLHFRLFAWGIAMEYGTSLFERESPRKSHWLIVQYTYIQRRIFQDAKNLVFSRVLLYREWMIRILV